MCFQIADDWEGWTPARRKLKGESVEASEKPGKPGYICLCRSVTALGILGGAVALGIEGTWRHSPGHNWGAVLVWLVIGRALLELLLPLPREGGN